MVNIRPYIYTNSDFHKLHGIKGNAIDRLKYIPSSTTSESPCSAVKTGGTRGSSRIPDSGRYRSSDLSPPPTSANRAPFRG